MKRILLFLFLCVPAAAQGPYYYYPPPPYYYPPAPHYRAPGWASPTGAALGPWKWNFDFGGGPSIVTGSHDQLTTGSNFQVGGGYNFTPRFGLVFEFMNSWMGQTTDFQNQNGAVDGDTSIWSFTVNPTWRFRIAGPVGGYLIGGGGFYERTDHFTEQGTVFFPTFNGGFESTGLVDVHQTDDTGGVNAGAGITWNVGWGSKLFVEARYHYIFTSGNATQIIPVTFGVRW